MKLPLGPPGTVDKFHTESLSAYPPADAAVWQDFVIVTRRVSSSSRYVKPADISLCDRWLHFSLAE